MASFPTVPFAFSIGEHVRVISEDRSIARLAYITSINVISDDHRTLGGQFATYDIIYCKERAYNFAKEKSHRSTIVNPASFTLTHISSSSGGGKGDKGTGAAALVAPKEKEDAWDEDEEEIEVREDRIGRLLSWELDELAPLHESVAASQCKDRGNALFALKDYGGGFYWYYKGVKQIASVVSKAKLSVGSNVLVQLSKNKFRFIPSMICDVIDKDHFSLCTDRDYEEECFDDVHISRLTQLIQVAGSLADRILQRSLYMNLAKSASKLNRHGWAVQYSCLARGVTDSLFEVVAGSGGDEFAGGGDKDSGKKITGGSGSGGVSVSNGSSGMDLEKFRMDENTLLVKSLLLTNRYGMAQIEAEEYLKITSSSSLPPNNAVAISKARQLISEVEAHKNKLLQSNRQLAKEVSRWVDKAMTASTSQSPSPNSSYSFGEGEDGEEW